MRNTRKARQPLVALVALLAAMGIGYGIRAVGEGGTPAATRTVTAPASGAPLALSALPAQAAATVHLIQSAGPFPYPRNDGAVFHNNEHKLPLRVDGYYHEYTVPTPGSPDRGARRIITGAAGEFWYSGDHYQTFRRVDVTR